MLYAILAAYLLVVGLLFVYGVNFIWLSVVSATHRDRRLLPPLRSYPLVVVQLPIYNERYVAERLIRAACAIDWPRERLEVQILDDSDDDTVGICETVRAELAASGITLAHVRRASRDGFKAGALAYGMSLTQAQYLAVFDADFVPAPNFLRATMPAFADADVAFVQTRWGHLNARYSLFTFLQALSIDAHFMVEQQARFVSGAFFNFNGTAGVWRRSAVEAAGGWHADTLTEDLDLSYRVQLAGWRGVLLRDVVTPGELPVTMAAFRRQQHRWAKGSIECALKLAPRVLAARLSPFQKLQALLHLTGYGIHFLMFTLVFLYPAILYLTRQMPHLSGLFSLAIGFNLTALAPTIYFVLAQFQLERRRWWLKIPVILLLSVHGTGMVVNTMHSFAQVALGRRTAFERTPKFGIHRRGQAWSDKAYQLRPDGSVWAELLLAGLNAATALAAVRMHSWAISVYAALFTAGLVMVAGFSLAQAFRSRVTDEGLGQPPLALIAACSRPTRG